MHAGDCRASVARLSTCRAFWYRNGCADRRVTPSFLSRSVPPLHRETLRGEPNGAREWYPKDCVGFMSAARAPRAGGLCGARLAVDLHYYVKPELAQPFEHRKVERLAWNAGLAGLRLNFEGRLHPRA